MICLETNWQSVSTIVVFLFKIGRTIFFFITNGDVRVELCTNNWVDEQSVLLISTKVNEWIRVEIARKRKNTEKLTCASVNHTKNLVFNCESH